jgi:hypothetical protein
LSERHIERAAKLAEREESILVDMRRRIASLLSQTADVELCTSAKSIFVPHYITSYFIYYAIWLAAKERIFLCVPDKLFNKYS